MIGKDAFCHFLLKMVEGVQPTLIFELRFELMEFVRERVGECEVPVRKALEERHRGRSNAYKIFWAKMG